MSQSIGALQKVMLNKLEPINIVTATTLKKVITGEVLKNKSSTYAGAVSSNLS